MGSDRETDGIPAKVRGALVTCLWLAKMDVFSSCSHSLFKPKWRKHLSPHSCYQWTHHAGRGWCYWHHCDGKVASTWNHWSCWAGRILSGVLRRRKWVRFWFIWLTNYMIVRPYNLLHFFFFFTSGLPFTNCTKANVIYAYIHKGDKLQPNAAGIVILTESEI